MGKYDNLGKVLEGKEIDSIEKAKFVILLKIANELAEANRIKRHELRIELKARSYRGMFKTYKGTDGKSFTKPPEEEDRKRCQEEWDAIEKLMEDQA